MTSERHSQHMPAPGTALGENCEKCGHTAMVHSHPPDAHCAICRLLEDMAAALLGLEECSICLALVRPQSLVDHEMQHRTNTNLPMVDQRRRRAGVYP